ncbi:hypothetical protein THAOC_37248 [Thalassiosira oceanica]|uniref:MIR domain-containing protein n=1 Tax=Thalassiosira oceanica TaxID=159749 RepID=K0R6K4_THAOC|nr:hypothetical protein THAOC_37248 [Thalassiosira oceanica]|eukprot:EJK44231.1 hypothetical protein THAOC_37248 [Thalassiosira oceanica]
MKTSSIRSIATTFILAASGVSADDENYVGCGSAVKLTHIESGGKYYLTSDERQLQSGSGQQLVTAVANSESPKGLWQIRNGSDEPFCEAGWPVKCGQKIRLTHLQTGSNLHTHGVRSPLSNQHEVTGFGQDGEGDSGDDWIVECSSGGYRSKTHLNRDEPFMLKSGATGRYLGASSTVKFNEQNCGRGCPILNQLEVFGRNRLDDYSHWRIELGVHLTK